MSETIASLELEVLSNSKNAVVGIDALTQSLTKLKNATKGGLGLSAVAKETEKLNKSLSKSQSVNNKTSASFTDLYHKMKMGINIIKRVATGIATAVNKSNEYVENLNLFTVSMGAYSSEALTYAETVSEAMGIDTSEWIRAQGVFMTMATGFGVASDRAATMSKNLTQLGYDLSSFYNIDVETAMQKLKSGLAGELEPLRAIGYDLSQAKLEATALELGITKSVSAMTQAEKAQLRYYAIMTQVTVAQGDMARTLDDPANQLRVLKSQLSMAAREIGNVFIPALNAILPYAIALVKVIRTLANELATLFGYEVPEVDYSGVEVMGTVADETSESMDDAQKSAKKLKQYMMGFDELNVINPGNGDSDALSGLGEFEFKLPEYDFLGGLVESNVEQIVGMIEGALAEIELICSGALLGIGAILAFSGANIPLGIALMVAGAGGLAASIATNWDGIEALLSGPVGTVTGIFSGAALAIGGLLAFSGANIPLGIALMMVGAAGLATTIAANWDSVSQALEGPVGVVTGIIGGALLGLGAILAFSGVNIPLGIALMLVGAGGLATVLAVNWDSIKNALEGPVGVVTGIVSGAVLALGAILAFSGANIPLGIALMLLGAGGLATVAAANWDSVKNALEGPIGVVTGIVSAGVLALGAILAFSGSSIPLGIALMLMGAAGLATVIATNWNSISDALNGPVGAVTTIVSGALLALGAIIAFTGAGIPLGVSLMLAGAAGLASVVALNWDSIKEALQGPVGRITALISGALLVLGAVLAFTGVGLPLGIALMAVGAAGLATVIALNWETIQEKIKPVIASILAILSGAMLVLGVLLCLSGAGIGLGLALIFGALSLSETAWKLDDNPITRFVKNMANGIINIINKVIDAVNDLFHIEFGGLTIAGVEIIPSFNTRLIHLPKIPLFAEGGFPESGQMFIAREAGAEMVGSIGRRTAVANNDQIVAGIANGVAEANAEQNSLIKEQNYLLRALLEKESGVYLDGRDLTHSVEKYQRERGRVVMTGGVI